MIRDKEIRVCIVGLGYVGLPLPIEFGKVTSSIGYDINTVRVDELVTGSDSTLEVLDSEMRDACYLSSTSEISESKPANVYIVTVPTPIDKFKNPDLTPLVNASKSIAKVISEGDFVIYESTVCPGATEDVCVPIIEDGSGLRMNRDFYVGYSPERINPGDKVNRLLNILKVTSGC